MNLSGIKDHRFCPEDLFFARIERILVPCDTAGYGIEDKNNLDAYFGDGLFPEAVVRYMRGEFYDREYKWLSKRDVDSVLKNNMGDLVVKPALASSGGHGVKLATFSKKIYNVEGKILNSTYIKKHGGASYIVQKKLESDPFSASFNQSSANTCRMMTLRCPWNGEVVVLKTMMRLGVSNEIVDNMMKGGLCVNIDGKGVFGNFAYDYDGKRYTEHPVSKIEFANLVHPYYESMKKTAIEHAKRIPYFNLLSFDLLPDPSGEIKIVEINATSQGITQLQFDHGGLFGEYTESVIEWCVENKGLDTFAHFRTFY